MKGVPVNKIFKPMLLAILLAGFSAPAMARYLGDPVPDTKAGQVSAGLALTGQSSSYTISSSLGGSATADSGGYSNTTIYGNYGLSDRSAVRAEFGTISCSGCSSSESEIGVGYRMQLGDASVMGGKPAKYGLLAGYHTITGTGGFSATEYEVGGGASLEIQKNLNVFFAGAYGAYNYSKSYSYPSYSCSSTTGKYTATTVTDTITVSRAQPLEIYGGADFLVAPNIKVGGEFHLLGVSGWGLTGRYLF